jgi:hypothetical protein
MADRRTLSDAEAAALETQAGQRRAAADDNRPAGVVGSCNQCWFDWNVRR